MKIIHWILDRLKERSTWIGITTAVTAIGVGLSPEQQAAIATAGVAVTGAIIAFTKD